MPNRIFLGHVPTDLMKHTKRLLSLLTVLLFASAQVTHAQRSDRGSKDSEAIGARAEPEAAGIAWFGTWAGALAEAKRTNRPILLTLR